jgi:Flp pilus assembly protein TadG
MGHRRIVGARPPAGRRDRGAVIVEFALVLPLLLILLIGIVEFGRAYNTQIALQGAAREGARALALGESASTAVANASGGISMTVSATTPCPAGNPASSYASVTTSTPFTFGIPFVNLGTRTLNATASMRCGL